MNRRALRTAAAALVILVLAGGIAAVFLARRPVPARSGTVRVSALGAAVTVRYDAAGVPHVHARSEADAWRTLGWLHASERLFQMEMRRRAAAGRLSELLGAASADYDARSRRDGYRSQAQHDLEALGTAERAVLDAYADGVNAFLAAGPRPLELMALGAHPEPWTPVDSLAFARLMQAGLTEAPGRDRDALDAVRRLGARGAAGLIDAIEDVPTVVPEGLDDLVPRSPTGASPAPSRGDAPAAGSNAWALAGSRTASGAPLLANDPHLDAERPGVWYAAHLEADDGLDVAGLTLAGAPGVIIGHNGRVAWGITMHQADDADLFVERLDRAEGVGRSEETVVVKGAAARPVEIVRTRHGPVVAEVDPSRRIVAAQQTVLDGRRFDLAPFRLAAHASDAADLERAWRAYAGTSINVCWATRDGHIGVRVAGLVPRRRAGDGRLPAPGENGVYDWDGTIAPGDLPRIDDPAEGFVVTANDDWSVSGRALPYPGFYAEPDRAQRARELAAELHGATPADMTRMQTDVISPYARRVVATLASRTFDEPDARRAAAILARWNGAAERTGPSRLFFAFMKELRLRAAGPGDGGVRGAWLSWRWLEKVIAGRAPNAGPDGGRSIVGEALAQSIRSVERSDGTDPARWDWGHLHTLGYEHPFARALPAFLGGRLAFGPVELPGEWHTLRVAGFPLRGDGYHVFHIASARVVFDLGRPDTSRLVLPLGQSGHLFDGHASDHLDAWSEGRDFPLPFSREAVEAACVSTLVLEP